MLASVGTWLQHFHGPVVFVLCGGLVLAETGLFVGFFFPGETAALAGGALASLGRVNVAVMLAVVVGCAIGGNLLGYQVGKLVGPWLVGHRPLRGHPGVTKAEQIVARYGGPGVFVGRWLAVVRALVPGIAGMSAMGYGTFVLFSVVGGLAWGTAYVLIGYSAGTAYSSVATRVGLYSLAVVGFLLLLVVAWLVLRRRRRARSHSVAPPEDPGSKPAGPEDSPTPDQPSSKPAGP